MALKDTVRRLLGQRKKQKDRDRKGHAHDGSHEARARGDRHANTIHLPKPLPDDEDPIPTAPIPSNNQAPTLLTLPAELRNKIYRLVLLSPTPISIDARTNSTQPALLRTNRQLRTETLNIYLQENEFAFLIYDLRNTAPSTHWTRLLHGTPNAHYWQHGDMDWSNLLAWLERVWLEREHAERDVSGLSGQGASGAGVVIGHAFDVVCELRGVPWGTVERVLQHYRDGVAGKMVGFEWK